MNPRRTNPSPKAIKAALKEKANMLLPVGTFVQAAIDEAVAAKLKETLEAAVELSKSGDEYQRIIADHLQTIHQLREQLAESRPAQDKDKERLDKLEALCFTNREGEREIHFDFRGNLREAIDDTHISFEPKRDIEAHKIKAEDTPS